MEIKPEILDELIKGYKNPEDLFLKKRGNPKLIYAVKAIRRTSSACGSISHAGSRTTSRLTAASDSDETAAGEKSSAAVSLSTR